MQLKRTGTLQIRLRGRVFSRKTPSGGAWHQR